MSLLDKIKDASVQARKERDKMASFLVTLYSEAANVGKTAANRVSTDEEVQKVVIKFKKNLDEVIGILETQGEIAKDKLQAALEEKTILEKYLPQNISDEELQALIDEAFQTGANNVGAAIKFIKSKVDAASVDMKKATDFIKDKLTK